MPRRIVGFLLILALVALAPACQKLSAVSTTAVPKEVLRTPGSIPPEWGRLVAVSSAPEYPDMVQLWLQDDNANIRLVVFKLSTGELTGARLIRRG